MSQAKSEKKKVRPYSISYRKRRKEGKKKKREQLVESVRSFRRRELVHLFVCNNEYCITTAIKISIHIASWAAAANQDYLQVWSI